MWEIDNIHQWLTFLYAIILGSAFCLIYDVLRLERTIFKHKTIAVFFSDILFWIIAAITTFNFLVVRTNGQPRAFVYLGLIVGFLLSRMTLSRYIILLAKPLRKFILFIARYYKKMLQKIINLKLSKPIPTKKQKIIKKKSKKHKNMVKNP